MLDNRAHTGLVRRILGLFGPYKLPVAVVGLLIVVNAGLGVINPLLVKEVFDSALFPADGSLDLMLLWLLAALMAVIVVAGAVLSIVQIWLTSRLGQDVTGDLQEAVYDHLLGMSLNFLARTRTGEMQSRVSHDVNGIEPVVTSTFADSVASVAALIAVVVAMLFLSWEFTVVAMAILPVFFLLTRWVGRRRREVMASAQGSMAQVTAVTEETLSLSGILLAKLFGRQHDELHHFRSHSDDLSRFAVRQRMIAQSFYTAATAFLTLSPALVYLAAGYLIFMGDTGVATAGTIIAFTALQAQLYRPVERLLQVSVELQTSMAPVRAHLWLSRPGAGDHRRSRRPSAGTRQCPGRGRLRLGSRQQPQLPRQRRRPSRARHLAPVDPGRRHVQHRARPACRLRRSQWRWQDLHRRPRAASV